MTWFRLIGILGMLTITVGVLSKSEQKADVLYIIGGIFLEVYSIAIKDPIFIFLQLVFILSVIFKLKSYK